MQGSNGEIYNFTTKFIDAFAGKMIAMVYDFNGGNRTCTLKSYTAEATGVLFGYSEDETLYSSNAGFSSAENYSGNQLWNKRKEYLRYNMSGNRLYIKFAKDLPNCIPYAGNDTVIARSLNNDWYFPKNSYIVDPVWLSSSINAITTNQNQNQNYVGYSNSSSVSSVTGIFIWE